MRDTFMTSGETSGCRLRVPLCWIALVVLDLFLVMLAVAQDSNLQAASDGGITTATADKIDADPGIDEKARITRIEGRPGTPDGKERFEAIDVFLDSGPEPLAAWQVELASMEGSVEIVGIEGGEHRAFAEPPRYDPRAMAHDRVILAAYQVGKDLPAGRTRVARVHVKVEGSGDHNYRTTLMASATRDGQRIPATLSIRQAEERSLKSGAEN